MKLITTKARAIVGTWTRFDDMDDITLAYNLADLTPEQLARVPSCYIRRWDNWRDRQRSNIYWNNPVHC